MDTATIVLGIGVLVSLVLGVVNLLARREKVTVCNSRVYAEFLRKGTCEMFYRHMIRDAITLKCDIISIDVNCELVLTRGQQELQLNEVEVILDKKACKGLSGYFRVRNSIELQQVDYYEGKPLLPPISLAPRKTARFRNKIPFDCTGEFEKEYEKMESGSYPDFIQPLLDELENKYHICWTRNDGKRLCWKFPENWWGNLGKRLWG